MLFVFGALWFRFDRSSDQPRFVAADLGLALRNRAQTLLEQLRRDRERIAAELPELLERGQRLDAWPGRKITS